MLIDTNNYIHRINGVPLYYNGLNSAFLHHSLGGHFDYHHPAATPDTTPPYTNNYEYLMPKTVAITEHLHNFAPITPPLSPSSDKQPPSVAETSRRNSVIMKVENCQIMPVQEAEEFVCKWENCYRQFESLEKLASHVTISHAIAGIDNLYYCKWEGCLRSHRGFNARYKMLVHCRTHTREKPHACQQCLKSFSRAENLKIHVRSHSGEKPYKCPFPGCGKAYSNSSDRFKHTRTHGNCKPYLCKVTGCNKRYTDPSSLRKHVKTFNHESLQMLQPNDITSSQISNKINDESVDKYYEHQITSQDAPLKSQDQYYYHTSESYFNDNIIYNGTYSLDTSDAIYSNNCNKIYYDSSSWISRDDISQGMKSIKIDEPLDLRIHRDR